MPELDGLGVVVCVEFEAPPEVAAGLDEVVVVLGSEDGKYIHCASNDRLTY